MIDFISSVTQYIDVMALCAAIVLTQILKYFLPSDPAKSVFSVKAGTVINRLMPFVPMLIAIPIVLWNCLSCNPPMPIKDAIWRAIISGGMASYVYRTTKVTLFGE